MRSSQPACCSRCQKSYYIPGTYRCIEIKIIIQFIIFGRAISKYFFLCFTNDTHKFNTSRILQSSPFEHVVNTRTFFLRFGQVFEQTRSNLQHGVNMARDRISYLFFFFWQILYWKRYVCLILSRYARMCIRDFLITPNLLNALACRTVWSNYANSIFMCTHLVVAAVNTVRTRRSS